MTPFSTPQGTGPHTPTSGTQPAPHALQRADRPRPPPQALPSVTQDGTPRIAANEVDRDFRQGGPRRVLSTDITYLPCTAARHGFMYPGAVIDCQTNRILAWNTSESLAEPLVLEHPSTSPRNNT